MAAPTRFTLSREQLEQYYDRVGLPASERRAAVADLSDQLRFLQVLVKHQLLRVPFENLTLHYSWHRVIDVAPGHVFRKIVEQPGRGGYCMELNTFFHTILLSLGFRCWPVGARVRTPAGTWTGATHLVIFVSIADRTYLVDVGFGSHEPVQPLPLIEGHVARHVPPAESRLVAEALPEFLSGAKQWIYQTRVDPGAPWVAHYSFAGTEVLPQDVEMMNLQPSVGRRSHFIHRVYCVRQTAGADAEAAAGEIDGTLVLNHDTFKWRRNGENVVAFPLTSDAERVQCLRDYFGITLDAEDQGAIRGSCGELRQHGPPNV